MMAAQTAKYGGDCMRRQTLWILVLVLVAIGSPPRAAADDLLDLYLGAAVGESHVRTAQEILGDTGYDYEFNKQHTGWKVAAGIRPISPLGVELEYIDFGNPSGPEVGGFGGLSQAGQKAVALSGVGYIPLPVPFLSLYGKLGVARLHTTTTEDPPVPSTYACPVGATGCARTDIAFNPNSYGSASTTNAAYGLGVQAKFGPVAVRAEFERLSGAGNSPSLGSLGVSWTF
jgi:hypothetical protein